MDASGLMIQVSNDIFKGQSTVVFVLFQIFIINSVKVLRVLAHTVKAIKCSLEIDINRDICFMNPFHNPTVFLNTNLHLVKYDFHLKPSLR